jgi:hypothetical protein
MSHHELNVIFFILNKIWLTTSTWWAYTTKGYKKILDTLNLNNEKLKTPKEISEAKKIMRKPILLPSSIEKVQITS